MPMLPKAAKYKVNPEYLSATYEDVAIMTELVDGKNELLVIRVAVNCVEELPIILPISNGAKIISDHNRNRFNRLPSGELQQVPRFVLDS